ncbi:MAG: hypothetical protein BJ554DRAFT_5734 [Olpidium bornovanus]|uniref:Uncharacterized protein n=1 Tax=Olpidium bornovanus TaxID=278681 RepID=A0A8H7ZYX9_9FUNG|nr:MAG: hypothetical protein BJ554DRAFT_5734 [Olpidium bornovanus]
MCLLMRSLTSDLLFNEPVTRGLDGFPGENTPRGTLTGELALHPHRTKHTKTSPLPAFASAHPTPSRLTTHGVCI